MYQSITNSPMSPQAYPRHLTGVLLCTEGDSTQAAQSGIWLLCQNTGLHHKQKDYAIPYKCIHSAFESLWKSLFNAYMPCQLSWIIQESLKYSSDLWLTSAGYQISNKKLTFVLFSALV